MLPDNMSSLFFDVFAVHVEKVCGISTFMRKTNQKIINFCVCVFFNKSFEKLFNLNNYLAILVGLGTLIITVFEIINLKRVILDSVHTRIALMKL